MLIGLFTDHPRSVGETYLEHMESALSFGVRLIAAGLACVVHAMLPFLFVRTGSTAVRALYGDMLAQRRRKTATAEPEIGAFI